MNTTYIVWADYNGPRIEAQKPDQESIKFRLNELWNTKGVVIYAVIEGIEVDFYKLLK